MESEVLLMIKSCIASRKGGVPVDELEDEYQELIGKPIPFGDLGYNSLNNFIVSIPEICISRNERGITVLTLQDEKVAHITALINKQKHVPVKNKNKAIKNFNRSYNIPKKNKNANLNVSYKKRNARNERDQASPNIRYDMSSRKVHSPYHDGYYYGTSDELSTQDCDLPLFSDYSERQAKMVNNILTITVNNDYTDIDYAGDSTEETSSTDLDESDGLHSMNDAEHFLEPSVFHYQMIGDDFFLHLAVKSLGAFPEYKRNFLYSSGHCISGQTIQKCFQGISNNQDLGTNIILLVGAVDVLEGMNLSDMKTNMLSLLKTLSSQCKSVVILTIPPLVNMCHIYRKWLTLLSFNKWLKQLSIGRCHVLDIWPLFRGRKVKMYDFFENHPKKIVGRSSYIVLWNNLGRKCVIEFLRRKLCS